MLRRDIELAWERANKALEDYIKLKEGFKADYSSIIRRLCKENPDIKLMKSEFSTVFTFNYKKDHPAFLVANFFGNEVYASLALLFCLENKEKIKHRIYAMPIVSEVPTRLLVLASKS